MRIFLITLLLMFGTQTFAQSANQLIITGEDANKLVIYAVKTGVMIDRNVTEGVAYFTFLVSGRYYWCRIEALHQLCMDHTGYNP